jgi:hypothetical protein
MFSSGMKSSEGGNGGPAPLDTFAVALYDYQGQEGDELTIEAGEHLQVIARHDDGWFLVHNKDGSFGVVPGNYLQVSEAQEPYTSAQPPADNDSMWQVRVVRPSLHMRVEAWCLPARWSSVLCLQAFVEAQVLSYVLQDPRSRDARSEALHKAAAATRVPDVDKEVSAVPTPPTNAHPCTDTQRRTD